MSFVSILLAGFCGWILAEVMARQSSNVVVVVAALTVGAVGGFVIALVVMYVFDFLDDVPQMDLSIIWAGNGALIGSVIGGLSGSLNGRRVAKRLGR